jgi:hypothetical protein
VITAPLIDHGSVSFTVIKEGLYIFAAALSSSSRVLLVSFFRQSIQHPASSSTPRGCATCSFFSSSPEQPPRGIATMDIGLELSEKGRRRHQEIEADDSEDEELESDILDHPVVRFQNNCFLLALLAGTLCFAVYVVSNVYFSENTALQDEYGGASSVKTAHATDWADAAQKHAAHHHTKGKPKDYNHKAKEIAAWQNATVSLQDGVKYKILDQLVHDNQAFT